jgi:hypothetical protein
MKEGVAEPVNDFYRHWKSSGEFGRDEIFRLS